MKRIVLLMATITSISMADFIGGELNLGYYNHSPSGIATYKDDTANIEDDLKWKESGDIFIKAYLEHPVPIIPNIKLGYTGFSHEGEGSVKAFYWGDIVSFNGDIDSKLALDIYDVTLYYEIFDNWINFDVGLNIKYIDGTIDVKTLTDDEHKSFQAPIPMLYAKGRVDLPATDISFQVEGNYISYDSNTLYDVEVGARYTFALGFGVEAGYKSFKMKIDDIDNLTMDADFDGVYGKVVWDF
jgi:outer membrane protein